MIGTGYMLKFNLGGNQRYESYDYAIQNESELVYQAIMISAEYTPAPQEGFAFGY